MRLFGFKIHIYFRLPCLFFLISFCSLSCGSGIALALPFQKNERPGGQVQTIPAGNEVIKSLNNSLLLYLTKYLTNSKDKEYLSRSKRITENLIKEFYNRNIPDNQTLSDSYYLIGVYFLSEKNYPESIKYLKNTIEIKNKGKNYDTRYSNALYNLGISYYGLGNYKMFEYYSLKSLEIDKRKFGENSPLLVASYSVLTVVYIELQDYEKALQYSDIALKMADQNTGKVTMTALADLYSNMGVCYIMLADFSKAKIYLEKCESLVGPEYPGYLNLMNSLAIVYGAFGLKDKANSCYEKGLRQAAHNSSYVANNMINTYALQLASSGNAKKGEELISDALIRAHSSGVEPKTYFEVLTYYADYLREFNIDTKKSLECYDKCIEYLSRNPQDISLEHLVLIGYSLSLAKDGQPLRALDTIQAFLIKNYVIRQGNAVYDNPCLDSIIPDKKSLRLFQAKYEILWDVYRKSSDQKFLVAASLTSELIVSLIEKIRINISEEDSRLILGDRYRESYYNAIRDYNLLYSKTSENKYLQKVFEYAEKSKVAGLLASSRQLKAVQLHIPPGIADLELGLNRDISVLNANISEETDKIEPDLVLINRLKEKLLEAMRVRDSLVNVFEHKYPAYYSVKYNTRVASIDDVPEIVGRNGNYINYLLTENQLYIFVANRKHDQLISIPVDSSFFGNVRKFKSLLAMPLPTDDARRAFNEYQTVGVALYKILIESIRPYLISGKLIISPDNILSYIPFETIPTRIKSDETLSYRNISYVMDEFDISYTYSATFMSESGKENYGFRNKLIAFAPTYNEPIDIQSVLMSRQVVKGILSDLPYARQEAEYVSKITGGKLFEDSVAKESTYKAEAGKYDIIHLAMHTLLNDKEPMRSTLIFSSGADSVEDHFLKTYEVYGIPLKAKMVVLSSCNTGSGLLFSGEGILSLARGFIFSGSQSVVMSMWEIEDRSGTEIVKSFYKNLKRGYSKSEALRKSRISYLKDANQLRSHPYFWSALVIYGNNEPLYYTRYFFAGISVIVILLAFIVFYFMKRRYS